MYDELKFSNCNHSKDPLIGCALEGVSSVIAGIKDVSIVIHSPQGCSSTVASAFDSHEVDFTKRKVGCTRLFESDIILGASEKLTNLIKDADNTFNTKVMFVVGTCAADIIGEDIKGLCDSLQSEIKSKLIPVFAGGFRGNAYDGIDIGLKELLNFIEKSEDKIANTVNIIAPQGSINPTWWADLNWLKSSLDFLGIRVQTIIPYDISLEDLKDASKASANILLSQDVGYKFCKKMEEEFNVPLILNDIPLPIGLENTARWLRELGKYFKVEKRVEKLIKQGEDSVISILRRRALMIIPRYRNCKIAISADATMGIGLVRMLFKELEMIPELILLRSSNSEMSKILDKELKELCINPKVAFGVDGYQIKEALKSVYVDSIIGSSWEKYIGEEVGIKLAFDNFSPTNRDVYVDRAYMGYDGMLNMLEIIGNDWERAYRSKEIDWAESFK
ncbi:MULTISPECIES: nitrogenase component 1 [unclassified Clostridium]|uniref:nitrogenase component 1 n=1 Tax=unclassified Clostridium TaxID=2614128 RepID=UPI0002972F7C|nr:MULTISPECIES: nitrogenase component 1 [unclassified Clostridium]EKQ52380.1 MAG: nitrogenase molybdenum-iron protein, alpha and beta chain [Clostridium sp. Maddingley MBC34-26]